MAPGRPQKGGDGNDQITASNAQDVISGGAGNNYFDVAGATADANNSTLTISDFVTGADIVSFEGPAAQTGNTYSETQVQGGLTEAQQAASTLGANDYLFVAGASDGYLFFGGAAGAAGGTEQAVTLTGLNSVSSFAATDVTGGSVAAPPPPP